MAQFWWPSYLMSKLMSICVNLIMWIFFFFWTSSIVCVFDFLTFDNFLTFWHLFGIFFNLNHLSPSQGYFFNSWCASLDFSLVSIKIHIHQILCYFQISIISWQSLSGVTLHVHAQLFAEHNILGRLQQCMLHFGQSGCGTSMCVCVCLCGSGMHASLDLDLSHGHRSRSKPQP